MATPPLEVHHPSAKSMSAVRGIRRALVRLFQEGKAGLIEPTLLGRLIHCLNVLQNMDSNVLLEKRIEALEARLADMRPNGRAPNGRARPDLHP